MPPKTRGQQTANMDSEDGQSAAGGATGGSVQQSIEIPTTTDKATLAALAGMFQTSFSTRRKEMIGKRKT